MNQNKGLHETWLKLLIVLLLVLGVFFRFANLDKKIYWQDETFTSLRISGYTRSELVRQVFNGSEIRLEDLRKYQQINPEKTAIDTIKGLALEEPQLPPLYFTIARFWVQWFGNSVAAIRSLSALFSLLAFPCIYWLCQELFESALVGWVGVVLIAISPFHVLYAQEARPYSLWMVTILLSSAALLRAVRLQSKLSWGIYAIAVALGFYSFLFSGFVVIGHGIYLIAIQRFKLSKTVMAFLLASLLGFLAFAPWLLAVITNFSKAESGTNWASEKVSQFFLVAMWAGNTSRLFFDFGVGSEQTLIYLMPLIPPILIMLNIIGYSIYFLYRQTSLSVWLFIIILIGVPALALILPDLILGGRRSGVARYLIPCYLGIQLTVAYLLATEITSISISLRQQKLWQFVALILLSSGVLSCAISSQAEVWWNKSPEINKYNPQVANIINQAKQPLLLSDNKEVAYILSLSYLLEPKVRLQLLVKPKLLNISNRFSNLFLYKPSGEFRSILEKELGYKIKRVQELGRFQDTLWRLEK